MKRIRKKRCFDFERVFMSMLRERWIVVNEQRREASEDTGECEESVRD